MASHGPDLVGLDIGADTIKLVELGFGYHGFYLKMLEAASLSAGAILDGDRLNTELIADSIRKLFQEHNIKNKKVAVGVSGSSVAVKLIQLPKVPKDELDEIIPWEAEQYLPFDPGKSFIDYQILPTSPEEKTMNLLLAACSREKVNELLQIVQKAGLYPAVVDLALLALENQYEINYHLENHKPMALIDIGAGQTSINFLINGSTALAGALPLGGNTYTSAISERLGLSLERAEMAKRGRSIGKANPKALRQILINVSLELIHKIKQYIKSFSATHQTEVSRILLSGGGGLLRGFDHLLSEGLGLPVERTNPFKEIAVDNKKFTLEQISYMTPLAAVGVGLATRRLGDKS